MTNAERAVVVDASVAAKWRLNDEELADEAGLLLDYYFARDILLVAPSLIRYELANTLDKARRTQRLSVDNVTDSLRYLLALGIHQDHDNDALIEAAATIASRLQLSVYDATYVALAEGLGISIVTNDQEILDSLSDYPVEACPLKEVRSLL